MGRKVVSKQIWQRFLYEGTIGLKETNISSEIIESWQFCRNQNVNPYCGKAGKVLDLQSLKRKKKQNQLLLDLAKPHIEQLRDFLKGWRYVTTLTDCDGYILFEEGENTVKHAADKIYFIEGAKWGEKEVGTNAIGLALRLKKPITVKGYEHFSVASQAWNCTAAPIFGQDDNLIGVLNISSLYRSINYNYVLASIKLAADSISLDLKQQVQEDLELLIQPDFNSDQNAIICSTNEVIYSLPTGLSSTYHSLIGCTLSEFIKETDIQLSNLRIPIKNGNRIIGYRIPIEMPFKDSSTLNFKGVKGTSATFQKVLEDVKKVSATDTSVHIYGETGTGKEVISQTIHDNSSRSNGPFLTINCGALPEGLLESELFGYEPGSFTGANNKGYKGKLQQANGGTLFLDEIEEMSSSMQVSLLRALQQREITRIGGTGSIRLNIRIITASNEDIRKLVKEGKFRKDLFYRIYVFPIQIPPLRERKEDIKHFINDYCERERWFPSWIRRLEKIFMQGEWQGNVRELYNALERCKILFTNQTPNDEELLQLVSVLEPTSLSAKSQPKKIENYDVRTQLEIKRMKEALAKYNGRVSRAAEELNISRATLYRKIKKFNL
ncbi:sigma-54-dependent Fis family transcriptional regulator [Oceanobacillus caeni]|uniref:sigma-54-dependent Fis family transcriptional regulator n=1 Tax=Oceanobacillus TaxID=182709 RepID=UPI0006221EA4|nr:sigma-54-dependent Fis family transcriptional regulator [Oceanobacillus caeni]KKE77918.1 hypothetical protein WH51_15330 [Bacilli bacterium VT-13-104]PZD81427.1 sigma-54-dependent Fis family transcriptional regulator [Bacilli bacterium]MBU8792502.1 sigma-54-dependent Fis family transcriptional regulator [Oceanobacillus caeni]MCR1836262.1 sigma-54-dependent Fis family transcriptional regulator [Oceanobacillus caeni]PZD83377.1 sigma-54-dependent Fis family transcriptional regulator [Bacilli b